MKVYKAEMLTTQNSKQDNKAMFPKLENDTFNQVAQTELE